MVELTHRFSVVPTIQPGETIHSAVLRLGRINGVVDSKRFLKELIPTKTKLLEVSTIFNQSPDSLLRHHTLWPLISLFDDGLNLSEKPVSALIDRSWKLSRGDYINLKFCPKCVSEDISKNGYSYWRTVHQIPGVHYCWEHLSRLRYTHISDYLCLPHEIVWPQHYDECPTPSCRTLEERYNQLLQSIMRVPIQTNIIQLIRALREISNDLGYSTARNYIGNDLSPGNSSGFW